MVKAIVLMTALPPTKGHMNLIRFAASLPVTSVEVMVCTQPSEPYGYKRYLAVQRACVSLRHYVNVAHLHRELPQDPETPGFWQLWKSLVAGDSAPIMPAEPGDFIVTSELYGQQLADLVEGVFVPYDPNRELYYTKATNIRENMTKYFHDILPEFQHHLRTRVTVFGAESTGKTTLSRDMSYTLNGHWLFEWARPYLETVGPEITIDSMNMIHYGQLATQRHADYMYDKPFVIQDTDLFSTVGYWAQPHWESQLGAVPNELVNNAIENQSDLYLITKSNIPFEQDVIRYGGDRRESPDEYWVNIAREYGLNYAVLDASDRNERLDDACVLAGIVAQGKADTIYYDRHGF